MRRGRDLVPTWVLWVMAVASTFAACVALYEAFH